MKRWSFNLVAAVSLLMSLTAAAAWAISYARPLDWHLLGIAHSADLSRVNLDRRAVVLMMPVDGSNVRYGFWDASWARSQSGRLTLVAHAIDYDVDQLRRVYASPPSVIVELSGPARVRAEAFERMPESRSWPRRLGFAWDADVLQVVDDRNASGGPVGVQARRIMVPYWSIVLLGLPLSLWWLRVSRRARRGLRHV